MGRGCRGEPLKMPVPVPVRRVAGAASGRGRKRDGVAGADAFADIYLSGRDRPACEAVSTGKVDLGRRAAVRADYSRRVAPKRAAATATPANFASLASAAVRVRSAARNRRAKVSDLRPDGMPAPR